ncbi:MAG TPA: VTT domain-containing protein [Flavisolibacter sp.]|nr:VTT domain-containing protein [Flavisolibacter sp.]
MKESILQLFLQHPNLAIGISLLISIVVAILGLVPSFFITAANILFFGFWEGTLISFAGEAIGAVIAFLLYRAGFKKAATTQLQRFPKVQRLTEVENKEALLLIFSLRLIPFVPSGLVTFAAAIGRVSLLVFAVASSIGKAPALLMEGYSAYQVTEFGWQGKLILAIVALVLLYFAIKQIYRK